MDLTEEQVKRFADVMVAKAEHGHGFVAGRYTGGDDPAEALHGLIQNVIVDTELLLSGAIPFEEWLKP